MLVNSIIIALSALLLVFLLLFLVAGDRLRFVSWIKKKTDGNAGFVGYIGLLVAVVTICISSIINLSLIKRAELSVQVVDGRGELWGEDEIVPDELPYYVDNDGNIGNYGYFTTGMWWRFRIRNDGDIPAERVSVRIRMDHVLFASNPEPDNWELADHMYGIGGYQSVVREIDNIRPDDSIILDPVPLENAHPSLMEEDEALIKKGSAIHISILADGGLVCEEDFACAFNDKDVLITDSPNEEKEKPKREEGYVNEDVRVSQLESKVKEVVGEMDEEKPDWVYLDYELCKRIVLTKKSIEVDTYRDIYHYYLKKINVYNKTMRKTYRRKAIIYGRLYYLSSGEDDVDAMINMDMEVFEAK